MSKEIEGQDDQSVADPKHRKAKSPVGPTFAEAEQTVVDLAGEIIKTLPRSRDERVTCRRITGNYYRCNWWAPADTGTYDNPGMTGLIVATHRIHKSQWLHVTKTAAGLQIKQASRS